MKLRIRGTSLYVDVEGAEWRAGRGGFRHFPPLFLLHGGPGGNHAYLRSFRFLGKYFQLFYVDQRGCGWSDPRCPRRTLTIEDNARDLEALRELFGFERISVLGVSYGCMLAVHYAARFPGRLHRLFLISGAGSGAFIPAAQEHLARHGNRSQVRAAKRLWLGTFRTQRQFANYATTLAPLYARRKARNPLPPGLPLPKRMNLRALNHGFATDLPRWNVLRELRRVTVPAFIACGAHDWICPPSQSLALLRHLPHARLRIYRESAHNVVLEQPRALQRDIARFILDPPSSSADRRSGKT